MAYSASDILFRVSVPFGIGTTSHLLANPGRTENACLNMVFAGMRGYTQEFDQRRTLDYIYKKHTASLKELKDNLKEAILKVMEKADNIIRSYEEMAQRKITEELLQKIKNSTLPRKLLPDYLQLDEEQTTLIEVNGHTEWDIYNDLSANIWHNTKTDVATKNTQFRVLHRVLPLVVRQP